MPKTLLEIAEVVGAELIGTDVPVNGVAHLVEATDSEIAVWFSSRMVEELKSSKAAAVVIPQKANYLQDVAPGSILLADDPRLVLAQLLDIFYPPEKLEPGISEKALINGGADVDPSARIEAGVQIEAGAKIGAGTHLLAGTVIGRDATVGEGCCLGYNVVVAESCQIGSRVIISHGTVIGSDGFGFVQNNGRLQKIQQVGIVVVDDDVEIGAGVTIDRATLGNTRIGKGTKIDNLVQVGHNVQIGENVVIAAQVGLSGSVKIGDGAVLGGQAGVSDHVVIGEGAQVGAKSGVGTYVAAGERVAGYPAMPVKSWLDSVFMYRRMRKLRGKKQDKGDDQ